MKKLFSISTLFLFLSGALCLMHSCVRPDLSDCPTQSVRLVVRTLAEMTRSVGDTYDIENVTVYVFDDHDQFVTVLQGGAYSGSGIVFASDLDLDPGTYQFVVWTNYGDTYTSTHSVDDCLLSQPSLSDLTRYMNCPSNRILTEDIQDLHHGILTNAVVAVNTNHEFTVVIAPNTYRVNFTVEGLAKTTDNYSFTVRDDNSHYMYTNTIVSGQNQFEHLRTTGFVSTRDDLKASIKTLRLRENRAVPFYFADETTLQTLYSADLVSMIKRAYSTWGQTIDFDNTFEFDIVISFRGLMGIQISVNGWTYMENPTEL